MLCTGTLCNIESGTVLQDSVYFLGKGFAIYQSLPFKRSHVKSYSDHYERFVTAYFLAVHNS